VRLQAFKPLKILVLMEGTLREHSRNTKKRTKRVVLILVLMEVALRVKKNLVIAMMALVS